MISQRAHAVAWYRDRQLLSAIRLPPKLALGGAKLRAYGLLNQADHGGLDTFEITPTGNAAFGQFTD